MTKLEELKSAIDGLINHATEEDCGVCAAYVGRIREAFPTPAASGAAPAEDFEAWLDEFDDPQFPELRRRDRFGERVIEDFRVGWDAALASREASSATLTDEQINDARQRHGVTSNGRGIKEFTQVADFAREVAALASPQVAPAVPEALYGVGNDQINWPLVGALIEAHMTASRYHSPGTSNWGAWLYKSIVKAAREAAPKEKT